MGSIPTFGTKSLLEKSERLFYLACLKTLLSATKVPKGRSEASNTRNVVFKFHFKSIFAGITKMQYAINKKPCAYPIAIVASGISHMYFRGIAIPISNKNETPSRNPISLNRPILLESKFNILIYTVIYGLAFDFKFMLYFFN